MKIYFRFTAVCFTLLIAACSPHPASGVWKTTHDNAYGISRLTMSFDGRAKFVSTKLNDATWHCFWSASGDKQADLDCNPSTEKESKSLFVLKVTSPGEAELFHDLTRVGIFHLQNENPVIKE